MIKGLPIDPGSAQRVYSSHVLEHLALEDTRKALRNVHSYLVPGGVFRFVLPDLEFYARKYLDSPEPGAASVFMRETLLGEPEGARGWRSLPRMLFGRSQHLWITRTSRMNRRPRGSRAYGGPGLGTPATRRSRQWRTKGAG